MATFNEFEQRREEQHEMAREQRGETCMCVCICICILFTNGTSRKRKQQQEKKCNKQ